MTAYYQKPGAFARAFNGLFTWLFRRGIGGKHNVTLEVAGRKTGQPRSTAVNIVEYEGQRYLAAPRGNTEWVRNVRAAAGRATLHHGKPEPVLLVDVPAAERAPILQKYLGENAMSTKASFGIDPKSPIAEFERISDRHPVFRITPA
jgi:deazaflavin-dependent oxidoreductase (nitroreductase family)